MSDREPLFKKSWKKALLPLDSTLQEAIRCLETSVLQIALVVDSDGVLLGTLTDGDIRRGLLRGLGLDDSIETIVFQDPIVSPPQLGRDAVVKLMQANEVRQLPIVDGSRRVIGLHLLDELITPAKRSNLMVIMAGGQGTRLRPHTENCPKPLLNVGGKPILEHIILGARAEGFQHFVLSLQYLGAMIEEYCGDGRQWGVYIDYLREKSPLGTAGALSLLNPRPKAPFVVSNGDVLTDISYGDMLDFHCRYRASATMAVRLQEWQHPFGIVRTDGIDIIGFEEKPIIRDHINAGIYVLSPNALNLLKENEPCDMPELFSRSQDSEVRVIVYPMHEPWLDVGRKDDLEQARKSMPKK
jgi:dTDP-glucose pyrophosphorylase